MTTPEIPPVVTLFEQYGAGADYIGPRVAQRLGVPFVGEEVSSDEIEQADREADVLPFENFIDLYTVVGDNPLAPVAGDADLEERYSNIATVREAVANGAVIVGQNATVILAGRPRTLHVFLTGPREQRIAHAAQATGISLQHAGKRQQREDHVRAEMSLRLHSWDPRTTDRYDLVLDTGTCSLDDAVERIVAALGAPDAGFHGGGHMRAIAYNAYGGPEVLTTVELPVPEPGPGEIRIKVRASGVNPIDYKLRSGFRADAALDHAVVPGREASGVVDALGEGVADVAVGDDVFGLGSGTAAEYAILRAWAPQPAPLSFVQSAGLALVGETAERALDLLDVGTGDRLLIHGAAGGVGQAAIQLARLRGATVIGTASERNHDLLEQLGAVPVAYGDGLVDRVKAVAAVPLKVLDAAGTQLDDLVALAASPDDVVTIANGAAQGRGVRFTGGGGDARARLAKVAALADAGQLQVRVAATFDLADAAQAHHLSESRTANGKIVLLV